MRALGVERPEGRVARVAHPLGVLLGLGPAHVLHGDVEDVRRAAAAVGAQPVGEPLRALLAGLPGPGQQPYPAVGDHRGPGGARLGERTAGAGEHGGAGPVGEGGQDGARAVADHGAAGAGEPVVAVAGRASGAAEEGGRQAGVAGRGVRGLGGRGVGVEFVGEGAGRDGEGAEDGEREPALHAGCHGWGDLSSARSAYAAREVQTRRALTRRALTRRVQTLGSAPSSTPAVSTTYALSVTVAVDSIVARGGWRTSW